MPTISTPIVFPAAAEAVIDVTAAPYHCDPGGRDDCTAGLLRALDEVARLWRDGLREQAAFYDEHLFEYDGIFEARKQHGHIFLPHAAPARILYLPPGTYLVSDTLRYRLRDISFRGLVAVAETRGEHTRRYPVDHLPKRDGVLPALPLYVGRAQEGRPA